MAFEGHICCQNIHHYRVVNNGSLLFCFDFLCPVIWGIHVDNSSSAEGIYLFDVTGIFVQGHMPNNMECMYTSTCGHIVDCSEFICGIHTNVVFLYVDVH